MTEEIPPLTLESLGVPTPESNREHIKYFSSQIERIIEGIADLGTRLTALEEREKA